MELYRPTLAMQDAYMDFAREWEAHGETLIPYSARLQGKPYEAWLKETRRIETIAPEGFVTADTFFYGTKSSILGAINVRHTLNDYLLRLGGHIGYGIRPSARRQGHASAMLKKALDYCQSLGMARALLTCDKENTNSAHTIQRAGGILESELPEDNRITQRYWITL